MPIAIRNISILSRRGVQWINGAPFSTILTVVSDTEIIVDCISTSSGQTGYRTYISTNGSIWTEKGTSLAPHFHATGLTAGTLYYFYMVDYKGLVESDPSNIASAYTLAAETIALFARQALVPNEGVRQLINKTIIDLKTAGTFAKLDVLILPQQYANDSNLNWAKNAHNAIPILNPVFIEGVGWSLNGTSQYIDPNYSPRTEGVQYTLNSCSFMKIFRTNTVNAAQYEVSGSTSNYADGSTANRISMSRPQGKGDWYQLALNNATSTSVSSEHIDGIYWGSRTANNLAKLYVNKVVKHTNTNVTSKITNLKPYIGAYHSHTGTTPYLTETIAYYENDDIGGYAWGAGLSQAEVEASNDIIQYYMDNILNVI